VENNPGLIVLIIGYILQAYCTDVRREKISLYIPPDMVIFLRRDGYEPQIVTGSKEKWIGCARTERL
jgi:hypothetical protein